MSAMPTYDALYAWWTAQSPRPTELRVSLTTFCKYWSELKPLQRFYNAKLADDGIANLKMAGLDVIGDPRLYEDAFSPAPHEEAA